MQDVRQLLTSTQPPAVTPGNTPLPSIAPHPSAETPHINPHPPLPTVQFINRPPHFHRSFNSPASSLQGNVRSSLSRLFSPYAGRSQTVPSIWEHAFYCCSSPDTDSIPTTEANASLVMSGLGKKNIKLSEKSNANEFIAKIVETFPPLKGAGGFKLMRSYRGRQLGDIPMPPEGYTVQYLKETSGLNRAVAYVVPFQASLPIVRQEVAHHSVRF